MLWLIIFSLRESLSFSGAATVWTGILRDLPLFQSIWSVAVFSREHGEDAVTHYKVVKEANGHSLVSLRLETGRTHQIRIHMKYLGYPLIGDYLYNPDMEYMTRQALHSHHMEFTHPITGEHMSFTAPLPEDMARVMQE